VFVISFTEAVILLKTTTTCRDEEIGTHTSICINNKAVVVEVGNSASSNFKAYKVGKCRFGSVIWQNSKKGVRYGIGTKPKIAINDENFVVEVDEETAGNISCRVGVVHSSDVMIWMERLLLTTGSNPSIALCSRTVITTFTRDNEAFYRVGTLDVVDRSISWATQEHKFVSGVSNVSLACNQKEVVVCIYTKQMVTSALSPLYATAGVLNKNDMKIVFSSIKSSSLSFGYGSCPSVALSDSNKILATFIQQNTCMS